MLKKLIIFYLYVGFPTFCIYARYSRSCDFIYRYKRSVFYATIWPYTLSVFLLSALENMENYIIFRPHYEDLDYWDDLVHEEILELYQ
mgnify:CR=1 FL=1